MNDLERKVEAVLFYKTEPVKKNILTDLFKVSLEVLEQSLRVLSEELQNTGLSLVVTDTEVQLVTHSDMSDVIEQLKKADLKKDIGKAGAETLAIIVYRGPISRAEIDRIRGVNSTFIIRNLLVRGLVEKRANKKDSRSFLYAPTPALFNHLGIEKRQDLPDFGTTMDALDSFEQQVRVDEAESTRNPFTAQ